MFCRYLTAYQSIHQTIVELQAEKFGSGGLINKIEKGLNKNVNFLQIGLNQRPPPLKKNLKQNPKNIS